MVTKNEFMAGAQPFEIQVGDQKLLVEPKKFSTGSVGYFANGKLTMNVGGQLVKMQANVTLTAIGSKEWSE